MPRVGDKVYPPNSQMLCEISHVHVGGDEVNLHVSGTNLERFRDQRESLKQFDDDINILKAYLKMPRGPQSSYRSP